MQRWCELPTNGHARGQHARLDPAPGRDTEAWRAQGSTPAPPFRSTKTTASCTSYHARPPRCGKRAHPHMEMDGHCRHLPMLSHWPKQRSALGTNNGCFRQARQGSNVNNKNTTVLRRCGHKGDPKTPRPEAERAHKRQWDGPCSYISTPHNNVGTSTSGLASASRLHPPARPDASGTAGSTPPHTPPEMSQSLRHESAAAGQAQSWQHGTAAPPLPPRRRCPNASIHPPSSAGSSRVPRVCCAVFRACRRSAAQSTPAQHKHRPVSPSALPPPCPSVPACSAGPP